MGQIIWISGMVSAMAVIWAVSSGEAETSGPDAYETAYAAPDVGEPELLTGTAGSALATAAFGMSALQPETYNSELVLELIEASHLTHSHKLKLASKIHAAEAGQVDLAQVLSTVRVALDVD
ncbi:MAG: hypothetical protein HKN18_07075 [Silicimonas sp.]|mgnify:CR=1 FL=1|nr:hypothetical protein [Silicimonas sp.]